MFGDRLKDLREEFEMTQEELGKRLNVTKQAVYTYEKGENEPSLDALVKIADIFDVSVDYLLCRTNQRTNLQINNQILLDTLNDRYKKKLLVDVCKSIANYTMFIK